VFYTSNPCNLISNNLAVAISYLQALSSNASDSTALLAAHEDFSSRLVSTLMSKSLLLGFIICSALITVAVVEDSFARASCLLLTLVQ